MSAGIPPYGAVVASPCVRKCCLDDDDICLGCGRAVEEIIAWNTATSSERNEILAAAALRLERLRRQRGDYR